jgi:Outer membrane protein beta-barrel domain
MRAIAVAAAVLCAATAMAAGSASAQGLSYGVKAGVVLADLAVDGSAEPAPFDFRVGLVAGGFVTWPLGSRLALQPEVLFAQKGASFDQGGGTGTEKLDYLDVPVLVSYRLFGAPGRHVSVLAGPSFGLRLRARSSASFGGDTLEQDVSDQVTRSDVAVVGGLAYHRGRLVFDGRYAWGLTDIDDETEDAVSIRNRGISFLVGWRF